MFAKTWAKPTGSMGGLNEPVATYFNFSFFLNFSALILELKKC
jgi:hypothetical protein